MRFASQLAQHLVIDTLGSLTVVVHRSRRCSIGKRRSLHWYMQVSWVGRCASHIAHLQLGLASCHRNLRQPDGRRKQGKKRGAVLVITEAVSLTRNLFGCTDASPKLLICHRAQHLAVEFFGRLMVAGHRPR